jgi:hypothetical protein
LLVIRKIGVKWEDIRLLSSQEITHCVNALANFMYTRQKYQYAATFVCCRNNVVYDRCYELEALVLEEHRKE